LSEVAGNSELAIRRLLIKKAGVIYTGFALYNAVFAVSRC